MEEFEANKPTSDEDRRLAEARKLTLNPLHTDIQPEELPELDALSSERATQAQKQTSNDAEDTANDTQLLKPATRKLAEKTILHKAPSRHRFMTVIILAIVICLLIAAAFWLIQLP